MCLCCLGNVMHVQSCLLFTSSLLCAGERGSGVVGMMGWKAGHSACKTSTLLLSFNSSLVWSQSSLGYLFIYTL